MDTRNLSIFSKALKYKTFQTLALMTSVVTTSCSMGAKETQSNQKSFANDPACISSNLGSPALQLTSLSSKKDSATGAPLVGPNFTISSEKEFTKDRIATIYVVGNDLVPVPIPGAATCNSGKTCSIPSEPVLSFMRTQDREHGPSTFPLFAGVGNASGELLLERSSSSLEVEAAEEGYAYKQVSCEASTQSSTPTNTVNTPANAADTSTSQGWPTRWNKQLVCNAVLKESTNNSLAKAGVTLELKPSSFKFVFQNMTETHTVPSSGSITLELSTNQCLVSHSPQGMTAKLDQDGDGTVVRYDLQSRSADVHEGACRLDTNPGGSAKAQLTKLDLRHRKDGRILGGFKLTGNGGASEYYIENCW